MPGVIHISGPQHMEHLVSEFTDYYNTRRAPMERDHLPLVRDVPEVVKTFQFDPFEVK